MLPGAQTSAPYHVQSRAYDRSIIYSHLITQFFYAAIQAYLGRKFGLMPDSVEDQAFVESLLNVCTDAVAEGRLAFHPKVREANIPL